MAADKHASGKDAHSIRKFLTGLARGAAGALLFSLPMLMTMELWFLGFYVSREKLFLLLLLTVPLLIVLAHRLGFERTRSWREALRDAIVAFALGIVMSALILALFGVIKAGMPADEILGKIAIQAVPAGIGALLGRSQLGGSAEKDDSNAGGSDDERDGDGAADERRTHYATELFMMAVGGLFVSLNVAPTEEMILVSYKMSYWHGLAMIALSVAMMHGFVYALALRGGHELSPETPWWHALVRFTLPGYVIALAISVFSLWAFERLEDQAPLTMAMSIIVLGLPATLGAAAARLIL